MRPDFASSSIEVSNGVNLRSDAVSNVFSVIPCVLLFLGGSMLGNGI